MPSYMATTKGMTLATLAADSVIAALPNPSTSGKVLRVTKVHAVGGFAGTAAATRVPFALTRATGTAAGGTGNAATTSIPRKSPASDASAALWRYGPAAVTGLTDDTPGDFSTGQINHQNGTPSEMVLFADKDDPIVIAPGTSLAVRTRVISVAGTNLAINIEWEEVPA